MPEIPRKTNYPWKHRPENFEGTVYTTFYSNAAWRRLRAAFLATHPICKHCHEKNIITPATEIDHIHPVNPYDPYDTKNGNYGEPLDPANLQALCKSCHTRKTAATKNINIRKPLPADFKIYHP